MSIAGSACPDVGTDIPAAVLCGGLGLRLRPVVAEQPKCLAPVDGRPFLAFLIARLVQYGFRRVVLCLGYRSEQVEDFVKQHGAWETELAWVAERQPLGTAGALKNAEPLLEGGDFVAMNGDSVLDVDFHELINAHRERGALATLALARPEGPVERYGSVHMTASGEITGFSGRPAPAEGTPLERRWVNGGVYVFSKEMFAKIPPSPPPVSLEEQIFPSLVRQGLYGFPCNGYFLDIGVPEDYQRAQVEFRERFEECKSAPKLRFA